MIDIFVEVQIIFEEALKKEKNNKLKRKIFKYLLVT
jgi:hypothetical protein